VRDREPRLSRWPEAYARCTGGGRNPWQNAAHAAGIAFVLAMPVMAIEVYALRALLPSLTLGQLLALAEHTLRWVVYGAFFGFYFTRLPGKSRAIKGHTR